MRLLAAILTALIMTAPAHAALVRVSDAACVTSPKVTLADVASIETAVDSERASLSAVVVAWLPRGESSAEVTADAVRSSLSGAGFNLARITISGASSSCVTLADPAAAPEARLRAAIMARLQSADPAARFSLTGLSADFDLSELASPVVLSVRPALAAGPVRFDLADAANPSRIVGHAFATLSRSATVVVAARRILAGHRISPADLRLENLPLSGASGCILDLSDVVGRRCFSTVAVGRPILQSALEAPEAVKRGDVINFAVSGKGLSVSLKTIALEAGAVGDVIRLKRPKGRVEYLAKITGPARAVPLEGGAP